jgi:hypothetical protein
LSKITPTPENGQPGAGIAPAAPGSASARIPAPAGAPLEQLFKMSTTAGLGNEDYVAVNVTAVVAALFGLASLLAAAGYVLFVIPITAIVLGFVSLRQIRQSNGTQTGRPIAWLALFLATAISAGILSYRGVQYAQRRADEQAIGKLCADFSQYLVQKQPEQAYQLFDDVFKKRVPFEQFKIHLATLESGRQGPLIESIRWNGLADIQLKDDGTKAADGMIWIQYQGASEIARAPVFFSKPADKWLLRDIPLFFPTISAPDQGD